MMFIAGKIKGWHGGSSEKDYQTSKLLMRRQWMFVLQRPGRGRQRWKKEALLHENTDRIVSVCWFSQIARTQ